jgi:hypothetical protein
MEEAQVTLAAILVFLLFAALTTWIASRYGPLATA